MRYKLYPYNLQAALAALSLAGLQHRYEGIGDSLRVVLTIAEPDQEQGKLLRMYGELEETSCSRCGGSGEVDLPDPASGRTTGEWAGPCPACGGKKLKESP